MNNKFVIMVMNFSRKMLSDSSDVSIKRVIAMILTGLIVEISNAVLWFGKSFPEFMFYGIIGLLPLVLGISAAVQMKALGAKSDVATEVVKNDATEETNQAAQDILQADKPK